MSPSKKQKQTLEKLFSCILIDADLRWSIVDSITNYNDENCMQICNILDILLLEQGKLFSKIHEQSSKKANKILIELSNIFTQYKRAHNIGLERKDSKETDEYMLYLEHKIAL